MIKIYLQFCLLLLFFECVQAQQLKLGDPTTSIIKSALLELNTSNQGLLLPRITDTTQAPLTTSPDGMIIYYTPSSSILQRRNGAWSVLADSTTVVSHQWALAGNAAVDSATNYLGTFNAEPINFRTNNVNHAIISSTGNMGIGTTTPSAKLHLKSGVTNNAGMRLENLTSASPLTTGAGALGVDASGNVVRTMAAVFYNAAGAVSQNIKIWADSISNISSGLPQVNISTAGFTQILSITATAKGGSDATNTPIASILSYSLTKVNIILMESNTSSIGALGGTAEGLTLHTSTSTRIFVNVIGY